MAEKNEPAEAERIRDTVREAYGEIAKTGGSCCGSTPCCGPSDADALAQGVGYTAEDLAAIPEGANLGLSCGNPTALASLQPGETVVDLGAGGGLDVFIAGSKVGASGRAIGVDMTPDMLSRARGNARSYRDRTGLDNVEFRLGEIEHLPLADDSVDAVLSNCVINLSPDKAQVWREIARVLKPGGRVAVSDLGLLKSLPEAVVESARALVGCVAGAELVEKTRHWMEDAGLTDIALVPEEEAVESMKEWSDSFYRTLNEQLPENSKISDYVVSLSISGKKPGGACCCGG